MKTKRQRQNWWRKLNPEQQEAFISKRVDKKRIKRNKLMIRSMKAKGIKFDCKKCCHGIGGHCTDQTEIGCTYFYDAINDKYGPAYKQIA